MKDPLQPERCARLLAALAAPERLRIVRLLRDGPRHVSAIADELGAAVVNASHHLTVLRNAGLVRGRKRGRFVFYSLTPGVLRGDGGAADFLDLGCCRLEIPHAEPAGGA